MALSRMAWIAAGLLARLLMIAVLAMTVQSRFANRVHYDFKAAGYNNDLQSYTYVVVAAVVGMAGSVLQIPVAVYLLCRSKRMTPRSLILDVSMYADIVVTVVMASGVGAGFGATDDVLEYVKHGSRWGDDATQDLVKYYQKGVIAIVFLLIGMLLSVCATVVSTRLRVRAASNDDIAYV
ncbi:CASP-like protein 4D1 [Miscanthus floridulus]|uniref:CASP-like protein 4D1 n=1 Tax=Miscanthus floridulus TaxID=154761 RepID=UPI003458FCE4